MLGYPICVYQLARVAIGGYWTRRIGGRCDLQGSTEVVQSWEASAATIPLYSCPASIAATPAPMTTTITPFTL